MPTHPRPPGRRITTRRFRNRLSRTMLIVLLPITVLPVMILAGTTYLRTRELLRDQIASQLDATVHAQSNQISSWIRKRRIRLELAVRHTVFRNALDEVLQSAGNPATANPSDGQLVLSTLREVTERDSRLIFNQFLIFSPEGIVRIATIPEWERLNLGDQPYLPKINGHQASLTIFSPQPLYEDRLVVLTSQPIFDDDGLLKATVLGISESLNILSLLETTPLTLRSASSYFITGDLLLIGINPYKKELDTLNLSPGLSESFPALRETYRHGESVDHQHLVIDTTSFDGVPVLAAYTWLPMLEVGFGIEIPQAAIFGQLNSLAVFTLTLVSAIILLVALTTWIGTNRLAQPLIQVAGTIRKFAEGDWSQRTPVVRDDEIGLLSETFNQMADQLSKLYQSLEEQVEERSQQIRTAAEIARIATSATQLEEILRLTVELIVDRFGFTRAAVYLIDETREHAILRHSTSQSGSTPGPQQDRIQVGSQSVIGWVTANNQSRQLSGWGDDALQRPAGDEVIDVPVAGIPIAVGERVLGALEVLNAGADPFEPELIAVLQTVADQIASVIDNIYLLESAQVDLRETNLVASISREIARAENEEEISTAVAEGLRQTSYLAAFYWVEQDGLSLVVSHSSNPNDISSMEDWLPLSQYSLTVSLPQDQPFLLIDSTAEGQIPLELKVFHAQLRRPFLALFPFKLGGKVKALLALGAEEKTLVSKGALQPYTGLAEMASIALEKVSARQSTHQRLQELQSLKNVSEAIAAEIELTDLYEKIFIQIQRIMGDVDFLIALYDANTRQIEIPYVNERGQITQVDPFPLGEGLTSIVIRTGRPLMLVEDTERRALSMGARIHGAPAKSWLGVPLIVADEVIGAIVIQDTEREHRFDEDDLPLLSTLSVQIAILIRNIRLLEESHQRAIRLEIASEISRDVSQSLELDDLLRKAMDLIRDRFGYYHASVFILDRMGETAVIRQSTGEVGRRMIAAGHHLRVGSNSIIGYVTARGQHLVINDVENESIHKPNPLLPETRAELGIPLKIGERIIGALDVQSNQAYSFSADDVSALQLLADQLAVAVANAELLKETQENLAQHRLLHHVTSAAASSMNVDDALASTASGLQATLGGDRVSILMLEPESKMLKIRATAGFEDRNVQRNHHPLGEGVVGWAASQQELLRVDDVQADPRYQSDDPDTRSLLAVPLTYRGELLGVISVESDRIAAYDENDQEMLGTLGGTLAAIIANTRLIERQRLLFDVTSKIRRSVTIGNVLETTIHELSNALGARRARIEIGLESVPSPAPKSEDEGDGSSSD